MSVYLDYNASSPIDREVLDLMIDIYLNHYGNADSRTHTEGTDARKYVEVARAQLAHLFGIESYEVVFTSGATESDNMAILGMEKYGIEHGKTHIITSSIEHKAILEPLHYLEGKGFMVDYVSPGSDGRIRTNDILDRIRSDTLMVCLMHANNETGVLQPIHDLGDALEQKGIFFLIDAAQTCGKLIEEIRNCKYDFLSASAHKFHGPQGVGVLVIKRKNLRMPPIVPIMFGGGQENGLRPGTLPVALIAGMGYASELAEKNNKEWRRKTNLVKEMLLEKLKNSSVKYSVNGSLIDCMSNTLNISFDGLDSEALMLAMKGVCSFSNGSACTAKDYSGSYVLKSMGLSEEGINCAVRLSWDVDYDVLTGFEKIIDRVLSLQT